jgi:glycosyltransferase involved in cell wall biosynthesis
MKVLHLIPALAVGGAEIVLRQLLMHPMSKPHEHRVLCIGGTGVIGVQLESHGIHVTTLGVSSKDPLSFGRLFSLKKEVERFQPDLIQTWMYHANLLAAVFIRGATRPPVVWALHQDISDRSWIKPTTMQVIKLGAYYAKSYPSRIISVSERGVNSHVAIGYPRDKFVVIPNGFDIPELDRETPGSVLANELALEGDAPLVGFFARYHPMKDHANFLAAAEIIHRDLPQVHFVLAGRQVASHNQTLFGDVKARGLTNVVHLLGQRSDVPKLLSSLDIYTISSRSEGFPLSVGEAMAAEVPCVVTDVGDAARLVGETGLVVPSKDPAALAAAWLKILRMSPQERHALGTRARSRIIQHFSLEKMAEDYYQLYQQVTGS